MPDKQSIIFSSLQSIEQEISKKLTVEYIADNANFSKFHYQCLFREIVGDSVMNYVLKRKMILAANELVETEENILSIAIKYGFDTHEGFSRSFKTHMGISPKDYRKYALASIPQKLIKDNFYMNSSVKYNDTIKSLNTLTTKMRMLAYNTQTVDILEYQIFWQSVSNKTSLLANTFENTLKNIIAISESYDEINSRFNLIKLVEKNALELNLLAFNIGLIISRAKPEYYEAQQNYYLQYLDLVGEAHFSAKMINEFLSELSISVLNKIKSTAKEKYAKLVEKSKTAADSISGYQYIKMEIMAIYEQLATTSYEEITADQLDDLAAKVNIIILAAEADSFRNPEHSSLFISLQSFQKELLETTNFYMEIQKDNVRITDKNQNFKEQLQYLSYRGNILLFYLRGEISEEKLGKKLSKDKKTAFEIICHNIDGFIKCTLNYNKATNLSEASRLLTLICDDMEREALELKEYGASIRFIKKEFENLATSLNSFINQN